MTVEFRTSVIDYHQHVQTMEEIQSDAEAKDTAELVEQEYVDDLEITEDAPQDLGLLSMIAAKLFQYGKA
ncbi:MAG: hypothetical protein AAFX06_09290 [Planctomycetota bacterium]